MTSAEHALPSRAVRLRRRRLNRQMEPYLYLLPAAIVVSAVVVYPLIYTAGLSLFDVNLLQPARAYPACCSHRMDEIYRERTVPVA